MHLETRPVFDQRRRWRRAVLLGYQAVELVIPHLDAGQGTDCFDGVSQDVLGVLSRCPTGESAADNREPHSSAYRES